MEVTDLSLKNAVLKLGTEQNLDEACMDEQETECEFTGQKHTKQNG